MISDGEVTRILRELGHEGDALDALLPVVYGELRQVAERQMRRERFDHTLQPTALVHEAYVKLSRLDRIKWANRAQFFAIAARVMRRVLVDHATARRAAKRGGGRERVALDEESLALGSKEDAENILSLHDALSGLERLEPRLSRIVECRYFAGLTIEETAEALDVSSATVKRDWAVARAWLHRELSG